MGDIRRGVEKQRREVEGSMEGKEKPLWAKEGGRGRRQLGRRNWGTSWKLWFGERCFLSATKNDKRRRGEFQTSER